MLPTPGAGEILLILLLVFIVFFGEKVGALGDAIGKAREQFRRGQTDDDRIAVKRVEVVTVTREADPASGAAAPSTASASSDESAAESASAPESASEDKRGA